MSQLHTEDFFRGTTNSMYTNTGLPSGIPHEADPDAHLCACQKQPDTFCMSLLCPGTVRAAIEEKVYASQDVNDKQKACPACELCPPLLVVTSGVGLCTATSTLNGIIWGMGLSTACLCSCSEVCVTGLKADKYLHEKRGVPRHGNVSVCLKSFLLTPCYLTQMNRKANNSSVPWLWTYLYKMCSPSRQI